VQGIVKMLRPQLQLDILDQPVVDHQPAQQRGLRLDILRQDRLGGGYRSVESEGFGHAAPSPLSGGASTMLGPPAR
jgi:hypothetical protein